jgi:hypothetical protein
LRKHRCFAKAVKVVTDWFIKLTIAIIAIIIIIAVFIAIATKILIIIFFIILSAIAVTIKIIALANPILTIAALNHQGVAIPNSR